MNEEQMFVAIVKAVDEGRITIDKLPGSDAFRIRGSVLNSILKYGDFENKNGKDVFVFDYEEYVKLKGSENIFKTKRRMSRKAHFKHLRD